MSTQSSVLSTHDLRSQAQDSKRAQDNKHKWYIGERVDPRSGVRRPEHLSSSRARAVRRVCDKERAKTQHGEKKALRHSLSDPDTLDPLPGAPEGLSSEDSEEGSPDLGPHASASGDPDIVPLGATAADVYGDAYPAGQPDIKYSYDHATGPSQGSQILQLALASAVQRFEARETEKLVKTEYELVDDSGEPVVQSPMKQPPSKGKRGAGKAWEEEYEFV